MPRQMRRQSKSKIYHVMIRGNERKNIFLDDEDRTRFINTLIKVAGLSSREKNSNNDKKIWIYAYCLMDNHVHLLINEGEDEISRIMKRISTSYAYYFNKKYRRIGHLFQDRFKSEAIENDNYLLAAARYIHNNPVKARICKQAEQYKWSSYKEYIGGNKINTVIEDKSLLLEIFNQDEKRAKELFIEYTQQESEDMFIEYVDATEERNLLNGQDAVDFMNYYLKEKGLELKDIKKKENINIRNELIRELRTKTSLSIRMIADLMTLDRGVVQRTKP